MPFEAIHHKARRPRFPGRATLVVAFALIILWSVVPTPTLGWQQLDTDKPGPIDPGADETRLKQVEVPESPVAQRSSALAPTDDGFTLIGEGYKLATFDTWRFTLIASPDIETIRPHAEAVAAQLTQHTGMNFRVNPGTVPYTDGMLPNLGEILIRIGTDHFGSPTCGISPGAWLACGGVDWAIPVYPQGLSWAGGVMTVHPVVLSLSDDTLRHVVEHELGHTVGLGHFSDLYEEALQVMHPIEIISPLYKTGDLNGLTYQSTVIDLDEIVVYDPATGMIDEMIQGGSGWTDFVSWTRYDDPLKTLVPAAPSVVDPGFDVIWGGFLGGDYDNDILLYDMQTGRFDFRSIDYNGGVPLIHSANGTRGWSAVVPGDFNGDGTVDLLFYRSSDGLIVFYTVTVSGRFVPMTDVMHGSRGWTHIVAGDYDGDGRDDVLWYRSTDGVMRFYSVANSGRFFPISGVMVGNRDWTHIPSGDFDGDGSDDLLYYRSRDGLGRFYTVSSGGSFRPASAVLSLATQWSQIESGNLDAVPGEDLVWYRPGELTATRFSLGTLRDIAELKVDTLPADGKITVADFR